MSDMLFAVGVAGCGAIVGFWAICFIAGVTLTRWVMSRFDD